MYLLDLTLDTPAENIALDEALLLAAENGEIAGRTLRLWEPRQLFVVVGSSSKIAAEVRLSVCDSEGTEILRRTSGGAAIVAGPGCLMYSLVLSTADEPELRLVDRAHCIVLSRLAAAVRRLVPEAEIRGTSDLAIGGRKFSGNSLRLKRNHLLYHGTLLYDFPLETVAKYLTEPPRQPEYRARRRHDEFVINLPVSGEQLREALAEEFDANSPLPDWPRELTRQLAAERFSRPQWNRRL